MQPWTPPERTHVNLDDQTRLGVGIIGTGKVGAVIGAALRGAGHAIVGVTGGSEATLDRAEAMLPGIPILEVEEILERAELVIFTVPDDQLGDLVSGLADLGRFSPGQIVMHFSGRYGADILAPAAGRGAITLALHPALSFTGTSMDLERLRRTSIAVTGPKTFLAIGQALAVEIGGEPFVVAEADRALYHAACSHASNHVAVVIAQAMEMLESIGIEDPGQVLGELVAASTSNVLRSGVRTLTGPVSRGDASTVRAHLTALDETAGELAGTGESYRAVARATVQRALANGTITDQQAQNILDLLA